MDTTSFMETAPIKAIVIDDEEHARRLLPLLVDWFSIGYEFVGEAADGFEALDLMETAKPDVVFVDISMPYMDGLELSRRVNERYPLTKIVIITAHQEFEYAKRSVKLGVYDFLLKPLQPETVAKLARDLKGRILEEAAHWNEYRRMKEQLAESAEYLREQFLCPFRRLELCRLGQHRRVTDGGDGRCLARQGDQPGQRPGRMAQRRGLLDPEGVVAQEYMFDDFKTMGFDSVRIPITWGASANKADRLSDAGFSSIVNPVFMARVDTVAGWGLDAGLAVVINAHHEDWIRTTTGTSYTAQKPRFEALWTQIAEHFKSWPPQLVFEIINEPWGDMTNADVNDLNATILAIIRTSNPTRTVILGANSWNSMFAMQDGVFTVPSPASDPYIIANFHNYNPYSFCGYSTGTWGSTGDIASMSSDLSNAATWASSRGVPLYMGEYGATVVYKGLITDPTSRTAWYREVSRIAKGLGISMAIWDHHLAFDINNIYGDLMVYNLISRKIVAMVNRCRYLEKK